MDAFDAALATLAAGDLTALAARIERDAGLVTARCQRRDPPYNGYFFEATLLHHCSGNPAVTPLPGNVLDLLDLLLDHGAEIDAVTSQGPDQPQDIGWTTLGLAATSGAAREAGVQAALVRRLHQRGAALDARGGGALMGALYYGEAAAAELLVGLGATVDLIAAAGLGRLDLMERHVAADGSLLPDAQRLVHYSQVPLPPRPTRADILALALLYACKLGRRAAAERLLELGADLTTRPHWDHRITPLHAAVLGDRPELVAWLLERGADPAATDSSFASTPAGWARHLGRPACLALLG